MVKIEKYIEYTVPTTGKIIKYKVVNGTAYHEETPDSIIQILEDARQDNRSTRLRFCFGDTTDGRDWGECCDTTGYIGRSTGNIKIPLLIKTINSTGGGGILDDCIVKVEQKKRGDRSYHEVYRHKQYHK